jgi:hypothetical protein
LAKEKPNQLFSSDLILLSIGTTFRPTRHNALREAVTAKLSGFAQRFRVMFTHDCNFELIVTPTERANEHLKLVANWLNTVATAIIAAGAFVPAAQFIFGVLPADTNPIAVYGMGLICIGSGVLIHLAGHQFLESLK